MDIKSINQRVRSLLASEELSAPGESDRAARLAVYAVATGEHLGMDSDQLIAIRLAAQLHRITEIDDQLRQLITKDETIRTIIRLSEAFDERRFGSRGQAQMSDRECLAWLNQQHGAEYPSEIVDALIAVQSVIQPIGT